MRQAIPNTASLPIVNTGGLRNGVVLYNAGAVDVYIDPVQSLLDAVDPVTGIPQNGIKLATNSAPLVIPFFVGQLFARCAAPNGALDIWQYCADCS